MQSAARPTTKPLILVAEDDPALMKMLSRVLAEVADVVECSDGMEAYTYLRTPSVRMPRLIITDVMMPRLDGLQLLAKLRVEPKLAAIPVIMLTAKGAPKDVIQGINAGVRHYVTKPFKQDDLLAKVKKTLGT